MDDAAFVAAAYQLILRRVPDPTGRADTLQALAAGTQSRGDVLDALVASSEFADVRTLDALIARARQGPLYDLHDERRTTERTIEIPWVLSRIAGASALLDLGSANAPIPYLDALVSAGVPRVVGVDLVEATITGMDTVVADVRNLPFADGTFDVVTCVSTIEHVGMDNSVYGLTGDRASDGIAQGLRELARVTSAPGQLLITTPVGVQEDHGWFVQMPASAWLNLYAAAGLHMREAEIYELGPGGWSKVHGEPAVRYGERGPGASAVLCASLTR